MDLQHADLKKVLALVTQLRNSARSPTIGACSEIQQQNRDVLISMFPVRTVDALQTLDHTLNQDQDLKKTLVRLPLSVALFPLLFPLLSLSHSAASLSPLLFFVSSLSLFLSPPTPSLSPFLPPSSSQPLAFSAPPLSLSLHLSRYSFDRTFSLSCYLKTIHRVLDDNSSHLVL